MVAGRRLELLTFRVWAERSNQLSYSAVKKIKWWTLTGSNRRPPACKAGALPAELRAHKNKLINGREDRIWTCDPSVPNRMLYQTEPLPGIKHMIRPLEITCLGFKMARPKGLEPLTFWSVVKRSIQLIYGRIKHTYDIIIQVCSKLHKNFHFFTILATFLL